MDQMLGQDCLRLLLDQFGSVGDPLDAAKVRYPLQEVLFLVTCATISGCDDYDEIADWGAHHLDFLKRYSEHYFGIPKEEWLRVVLNRIDPALFEACFTAWARSLRPDGPEMIALDGKTLRRSGDRAVGQKPLHLVSVWASSQRLVLSQEAVDAKANARCVARVVVIAGGKRSTKIRVRHSRERHRKRRAQRTSLTSRPCAGRSCKAALVVAVNMSRELATSRTCSGPTGSSRIYKDRVPNALNPLGLQPFGQQCPSIHTRCHRQTPAKNAEM